MTEHDTDTDEIMDDEDEAPKPCRHCGGDGYTSEIIMRGAWEGTPDYRPCRYCRDPW